ncbi:MAG: hypothetical protein E7290_07835 [Lachnospiraceae bacterium]|nr:hypothetical protein [Lachnospiraceae bacterium]
MKKWKNIITTLGILLWIGGISPELFIDPKMGCFVDETGEALTEEEARQLYDELYLQEDGEVQIMIGSRIWEWMKSLSVM